MVMIKGNDILENAVYMGRTVVRVVLLLYSRAAVHRDDNVNGGHCG